MERDNLKWLSELDPETDLNEHYREVVDVIGLEATLKLAAAFPSIPVYLANPHYILKQVKIRYVMKHAKTLTPRRLALNTGFSERMIYKLIEDKDDEGGWKQESLI